MSSISIAAMLLEEQRSELKCLRVQRKVLRDACNPFEMDDKAFVKNFRLNKVAFKYVLDVVQDVIGPSHKCGVTALGHVVCTLRFLAEGGYQHGVGKDNDIGMAQATVSTTLERCLTIMEEKLCSQWIRLEMTTEEKREAKIDFFSRSQFPGVVMCVDGTHIKIIPPAENKFLYYNRKGYYSINAMIVCDSKMRIRCIDARYPGSNHDSHVWNLSDVKEYFQTSYREGERNTWILGDAGYPLQPWLMTPFRSPEDGSRESVYNKMHAKARNMVERTIGVVKNRFRCILGARQLHYTPRKAAKITNVCCALHNICLHYGVEEPFVENESELEESMPTQQNEAESNTNEAFQIRQIILRLRAHCIRFRSADKFPHIKFYRPIKLSMVEFVGRSKSDAVSA